jgi:hypothetical protein
MGILCSYCGERVGLNKIANKIYCDDCYGKIKRKIKNGYINEITKITHLTLDDLISFGWDLKYRGRHRLVFGLLFLFGGVIAIIISFNFLFLTNIGEYYKIFYGPIGFGLITLIRAAIDFSRSKMILSALKICDSVQSEKTR